MERREIVAEYPRKGPTIWASAEGTSPVIKILSMRVIWGLPAIGTILPLSAIVASTIITSSILAPAIFTSAIVTPVIRFVLSWAILAPESTGGRLRGPELVVVVHRAEGIKAVILRQGIIPRVLGVLKRSLPIGRVIITSCRGCGITILKSLDVIDIGDLSPIPLSVSVGIHLLRAITNTTVIHSRRRTRL